MKIIFLGDSITEGGRDRSDPASLGSEYVDLFYNKLRNLYENTALPFSIAACLATASPIWRRGWIQTFFPKSRTPLSFLRE